MPRGQAPDAVDRRGDPVGIRRFHLRAPGHLPGREGIPAQARDRPGAQGRARPHLRPPGRGAPRPRGHGPHAPPPALRQPVRQGKAALLPLYRRAHGGGRGRRHDRADAHFGHQPRRQVLRRDRHGLLQRGRLPLGAARRALRPGRGQRRHRAGVRRQAGRPRAGAGRQRGRHRGPRLFLRQLRPQRAGALRLHGDSAGHRRDRQPLCGHPPLHALGPPHAPPDGRPAGRGHAHRGRARGGGHPRRPQGSGPAPP